MNGPIYLTYKSALEVVRRADFPRLVEEWGDASRMIPDSFPSLEGVADACRVDPLLEDLTYPLHLLVSTDRCAHSTRLATRHVSTVRHPPGSFVRVGARTWVSSPELLPFQMARTCTPVELALLLDELLGIYAIDPSRHEGMLTRDAPLTTKGDVEAFLHQVGSGYGSRKVRAALPLASQDSASPMESKLALRVRAPRELGGYGTEFVSMNEEVSLRPIGDEFDARRIRKPDILFLRRHVPEHEGVHVFRGVALDYNGAIHLSAEQAAIDDDRRIELLAHDIKPYAVNKQQYDSIESMDFVMDAILRDLDLPRDVLAEGRELRVALHDELERYDCVHWSGERRGSRGRLPEW